MMLGTFYPPASLFEALKTYDPACGTGGILLSNPPFMEPTRHEVSAAAAVLLQYVGAIERRAADLLRQEEALQEAAQSTTDGALADALMGGAFALDAQRTSLCLDLAVAAAPLLRRLAQPSRPEVQP